MKMTLMMAAALGALLMSGCSSKSSLLVPGQIESDCAEGANKLGVCGNPMSIYENRDKIKKIYYEEGESYRVDRKGKVFNIDSGEEVIPGVRPDDCGTSVCPGCDDEESAGGCGSSGGSPDSKGEVRLAGRSMIVKTPQESTVIRDMGWQQKVWIAPYETKKRDLVEAHGIYVVVKEPSWIIGEQMPQRVKRGVVVSSPLVIEVLTDNHMAVDRKTTKVIDDYVRSEHGEPDLRNIREFIKKSEEK